MLINYLNVLGGLLALAAGAFALTYEILNWYADNAADRALDDGPACRFYNASVSHLRTLPAPEGEST